MRIDFTYPIFPDHTEPKGALPNRKEAQACWYFYLLAQKQKEKVGESTDDQFGLLEGERWMDTHYVQTARTVAMLYGLSSPDEFAKHWNDVKKEAWVCGLPIPHDSYTRLMPGIIHS